MGNPNKLAEIATETVQICATGSYVGPSGKTVSIADNLRRSIEATRLFSPDQLGKLAGTAPSSPASTKIRVVNCTTLSAAKQLRDAYDAERVALLNFASAKNPGGGFLDGAQAQEESLARASGLYPSIRRMAGYYEANGRCKATLYTDHMIYSPLVPVFRDDADRLIDDPWCVAMITAPAVNAGAVGRNEPENVSRIRQTRNGRIEYVLALGAHHGHDALVLGAWGCGVFRNDPRQVAELFAGHLLNSGRYAQAFKEVVFAVLDRNGDIIRPFAEVFGR